MRRTLVQAIRLLVVLPLATLIGPVLGQPVVGGEGRGATYSYAYSYTSLYQFETDVDEGGSFDVSRHFLRFGVMRSFSRRLRVGVGLSYDLEKWDFDDVSSIAGASPWSTLHRPGVSLPILYAFPNGWMAGVTPAIEFSGESGAEVDESFTYGGTVSLAHSFDRDLYLGAGFGVFDRLETTAFFPILIINWKINEQFRLSNPFRAGPAGPAGLELVYSPNANWELGIGGAYRSYRFRLDDVSAVPNGVGENEFWATFVRVQRKLGSRLSLDLAGGALFDGELTIENSNGNKLGSDRYDPAPVIAITLAGKF